MSNLRRLGYTTQWRLLCKCVAQDITTSVAIRLKLWNCRPIASSQSPWLVSSSRSEPIVAARRCVRSMSLVLAVEHFRCSHEPRVESAANFRLCASEPFEQLKVEPIFCKPGQSQYSTPRVEISAVGGATDELRQASDVSLGASFERRNLVALAPKLAHKHR